jgi:hypothetical protein
MKVVIFGATGMVGNPKRANAKSGAVGVGGARHCDRLETSIYGFNQGSKTAFTSASSR